MSGNNQQNGHASARALADADASQTGKRRTPWGLAVVAVLFVVMPFLTWYGTSFWRTLTGAQVEEYLADTQNQRHVQHALEEIDRRIIKGDDATRRWYPRIIQLSTDQATDLRLAAAWVMGDDNRAQEFHDALLRLLEDQEPAVRRMAALSLSRFNDPRCNAELAAMLRDYAVGVGVAGKILTMLPAGSIVSRQAMIARVRTDAGEVREVRSPLAGRVKTVSVMENSNVNASDELLVLAPDGENVLQSLRALYLVGSDAELAEVERYARGVAGVPDAVQKQATLTAEAIKRRASKNP
ncbi:MAG: hypothetical protein QOE33_2509 [Acidobacteriota bacterium]|nr:hypothetical protein [Acidobacteriota bacterium]